MTVVAPERHGTVYRYTYHHCRCFSCRRAKVLSVRAFYETACVECGSPCWGRGRPGARCMECVKLARERPLQPRGLHYEWGCP